MNISDRLGEETDACATAGEGIDRKGIGSDAAFWSRGEASTVAEVRDDLAGAGRELAYTTVATLVRILNEKEFLEQMNDDRPYRFRPSRTHEEVSRSMVGDVLDRLFDGSRELMLMRLFEGGKLSAKERAMLEQILKEKRR